MTAKKSSSYGECGSCEHLFLFLSSPLLCFRGCVGVDRAEERTTSQAEVSWEWGGHQGNQGEAQPGVNCSSVSWSVPVIFLIFVCARSNRRFGSDWCATILFSDSRGYSAGRLVLQVLCWTGWPGVSILWLGEIESLMCSSKHTKKILKYLEPCLWVSILLLSLLLLLILCTGTYIALAS